MFLYGSLLPISIMPETPTLDPSEKSSVDLQGIVDYLGSAVKFEPGALSPNNVNSELITGDKEYPILGMRKRYDLFDLTTDEPLPDAEVDGVLVTIVADDGQEHEFGHNWFIPDSSSYEI